MKKLPYPTPTSPSATKAMRANRRADTKPEVALRSLLHRSGLRFRKDHAIRRSDGRPVHCDIAFTRRKLAVFVDGCFWHCCPEHGTVPKSNQAYWIPKLKQNVDRDKKTNLGLQEAGWSVLRFWEHISPEEARAEVLRSLAEV